MAKVIYVCARNHSFGLKDKTRLKKICEVLEPDNIVSQLDHRVLTNNHIAFAIMNYQPSIIEKKNSLLLGYLYDRCERWDEPRTDFPDGSYTLFRDNDDYLEVAIDAVGSRTIWYYFDENWFIASTSQRAIVMFLGSFHFDDRVIPWLLSTGALGPELSWDKRFMRLPVDSSVILDKKSWSISIRQTPVHFAEQNRSDAEHKKILHDAIGKTIKSLGSMNFDHWVLPLSGGYDSRGILCFLNEAGLISENLRTITWGLEKSINETGNDAKLAKDLASRLGVEHKYYHTDLSEEAVAKVIDRFLFCGEGRIDYIGAYLDGMKIWRDLHGDGVLGIIRGDQCFGWTRTPSVSAVKYSISCALCSDYSNLVDVIEKFGLPDQKFPVDFKQKKGESLIAWRERLFHTYLTPTIFAALSDLKFSYVELITPFQSRLILSCVRALPDRLRTDKVLFKEIVNTITPEVPYASKVANASLGDVLKKGPVVELLYDTLQCDYSRKLFSPEFLSFIINGINVDHSSSSDTSTSFKKFIKKLTTYIKNLLIGRGVLSQSLDANRLAFRVYIIIRMHQILSEDCNKISS